jgi:DNA-binding NarL/FixJ family response regulator
MASRDREQWAEPENGKIVRESGLDAIGGPALILDPSGEVLRANAAAQALLDRDGSAVKSALASTIAGDLGEHLWELTPLRDAETPLGFLALLTTSTKEGKLDDAVREATRLWKLTARQQQVLVLVAQGWTNALVAETLAIGDRTVEFHVSAIFDKAGVDNRATLMAKLLEL